MIGSIAHSKGLPVFRANLAHSNETGGIAAMDLIRGDVPRNHASASRHSAFPDLYTGRDHGSCTHPCAISQRNRLHDERKRRIGPVMIAGAKIRSLGDAHIVSDLNVRQIVNPAVFSKPAIVAQGKAPRVLHANAGL